MKKMRGVVDPISLGFLLVVLGAGFAAATNSGVDNQENTAKAKIEAPVIVNNRVVNNRVADNRVSR